MIVSTRLLKTATKNSRNRVSLSLVNFPLELLPRAKVPAIFSQWSLQIAPSSTLALLPKTIEDSSLLMPPKARSPELKASEKIEVAISGVMILSLDNSKSSSWVKKYILQVSVPNSFSKKASVSLLSSSIFFSFKI